MWSHWCAARAFVIGEDIQANLPLIVNILSGDIATETGESNTFIADANDPDEDPITYEWFIDDVLQSGETSAVFTWAFISTGTYAVRVVVSDGEFFADGPLRGRVQAVQKLERRRSAFPPYVDTGLASETAYYYRVTAFNTYGESAMSPTATATTIDSTPPNRCYRMSYRRRRHVG